MSGHTPEPGRRTGRDRCIELWYAKAAQFFEAIGSILPLPPKTLPRASIGTVVASVLAMSLFGSKQTLAQITTNWTGTASSDWFTDGNWNLGVPTSLRNATEMPGTLHERIGNTLGPDAPGAEI